MNKTLLIIAIVILVVSGGIYWWQADMPLKFKYLFKDPLNFDECKEASGKIMEVKPPMCEFRGQFFSAPCDESGGRGCEIQDETTNWQTYRNEEYGFEVKYPTKLTQKDSDKSPSDKFGVVLWSYCSTNTIPALVLGIRITVADYADGSSITNWIKNYENEEFFKEKAPDINKFTDFSIAGYIGKRIMSLGRTYYKAGTIEDRVMVPKDLEMFVVDAFWDGQESVANSSNGQQCIGEIKSIFDQILSTFKFTK